MVFLLYGNITGDRMSEIDLDFKNQFLVLRIIEELVRQRGISCIINTHFPEHALSISDQTLMMGDNHYIFGKTEDIITEENVAAYFDVNARILKLGEEYQNKKAFVILGER